MLAATNATENATTKPKRALDRSGRLSGAARQAELAREAEAERIIEVGKLVADLGGRPSAIQQLLIDELAGLAVRARRLRRQGKPTDEIAMLMTRVAGRLGIKPGTKAPGPTLTEYLKSRAAASPVAPSPPAAALGPADETRTGGALPSSGGPKG